MVIRDRLHELRMATHFSPQGGITSSNNPSVPTEISVHRLSTPADSSSWSAANNMAIAGTADPFLERIHQMRHSLEQLQLLIRQLHSVQDAILGQTIVQSEDKDQLDTLIEQIGRRAKIVRTNLRQLEAELAQEKAAMAGEGRSQLTTSAAQQRIRQNQADQLRRMLNEVLETFHSAQADYRERVTRRVKRQLELAGEQQQFGPGEVERLLEDKSEQIFYRHQHSPLLSLAGQMALQDASSRHEELLRLEQSVGELTECFRDMLTLVHSQGELVDRIETNINAASEYTGQARMQIHRAVAYRKSAQRWKCVIVLLVVGAVLVLFLVLAILLGTFMPHFGSH